MGQVTIYLDDEVEARMRAEAKSANLSQSKWIANLIREKIDDEWPMSIRTLSGAWKDFPDIEDIRGGDGSDSPREAL